MSETTSSPLSLSNTQAIIDKSMSIYVPAGHTNAIIGTIDPTGLQFITSFKLNDNHWSVTGVARHDWSGDNSVAASLVFSW